VLRRQLVAPAIGLLFGGALGAAFAVRIHDVLRSVRPDNPAAFGGVALVVASVVLVAILLPTRRLLRGAPMRAILGDR
jgi:hypothetical protein